MSFWRYNADCKLHWWSGDEEKYFAHNCMSGQTHVLTPLAVETIGLFKKESFNEKDIFEQLFSMYEDSDDAKIRQHILNMLVDLDEIGLIEPCSV